jgi:uncharacterized membrane protein YdbT with pleckstrin-like domain
MGYIETVLQPGETVRFRTNFHWIGFVPGLVLLVPAAFVYLKLVPADGGFGLWMLVALLLLAAAIILLAKAWYDRFITEIAITDKRLIDKTGFISRSTDEMPLAKVENIEVSQSILGRLLDYGNVDVRGTGSGGIGSSKLRQIAAPLAFRNHVMAG